MNWKALISRLPKGLTFTEVAKRLGTEYQSTRHAIIRYRYPAVDGRSYGQRRLRRLVPERIDWSLSNIEIARRLLVSRERVRVVRKALGKKRVEARGRPSKER
jgi:hypothetical protein